MESIERLTSKLGTKEYWDELYTEEINQFKNNNDLVGDVWFGEQTQNKIIDYIKNNISKDKLILDLGCGNCEFLFRMFDEGYSNLDGLDYSETFIEFVNEKIKVMKNENIKFNLYCADINQLPLDKYFNKYDLIHDKGTLDAFMLFESNKHENYVRYILNIAKSNSMFIITSCTFTKSELLVILNNERIKLLSEIEYKKFSFGGQDGQRVTTLVFKIE